jgi:hypothetical protein
MLICFDHITFNSRYRFNQFKDNLSRSVRFLAAVVSTASHEQSYLTPDIRTPDISTNTLRNGFLSALFKAYTEVFLVGCLVSSIHVLGECIYV